VVCHALDDVSSEGEDDTTSCLMMLDSCSSNLSTVSNISSSSNMAVDVDGDGNSLREGGAQGRRRCSSSSGGGSSVGRVSAAGSMSSVNSVSSGGSSVGELVMAMSTSFSGLLQPTSAV
jgi:hypothetical protein